MRKNIRFACLAILLALALSGCGSLLYSQTAPEAKDFHPQSIGVLPVDTGPFEEARDVVDDIIAAELVKRKWFRSVIAADAVRRSFESGDELKKAGSDYLAKLKALNYSDPELSRRIGDLMQADACSLSASTSGSIRRTARTNSPRSAWASTWWMQKAAGSSGRQATIFWRTTGS